MWTSGLIAAAALVFWFGFGAPFQSPKLIAIAAVIAVASFWSRSRLRLDWRWLVVAVWPLITVVWMREPRDWLMGTAVWAVLLAAWSLRPLSPAAGELVRHTLALIAIPTTLYLIAQHLGWDPIDYPEGTRPGSFWGNPNYCGHVLVLCLCLGRLPGRLCWVATGFAATGIALTAAKGALAALVVWALVTATPKTRRIALLCLVPLLALSAWWLRADLATGTHWLLRPASWSAAHAEQPLMIAAREPWFRGKRASLVTRVILWGNSAALLSEHAARGVGTGQLRTTYPRYAAARIADPNTSQIYRPSAAHNWLLDAAIAFGIPWLALFLYLLARFFRDTRSDRAWWLAFALQAGIGLVSLSYLNPVILIALILTAPSRGGAVPARPAWWTVPLCLAAIATATWSDLGAAHRTGTLFPENRARLAYAAGDQETAWRAQIIAWDRDPFGPDILFNLGLMAESRGEPELALDVYALIAAACPHYRPARARLVALGETARIEVAARDLDAARARLRERVEPG